MTEPGAGLVLDDVPDVDAFPRRLRRRRRGSLVIAAALAVAGVAIGLIASDEVATNAELDRTHRSLDITRDHLRAVVANLATVGHQVGALHVQVFLVSKALAADQAALRAAQAQLSDAQTDVSRQTTTITDLQTCLGGVQQALNALSVGDQGRAIAALNSVASSCNATAAAAGA
jgi:hypothetical protein